MKNTVPPSLGMLNGIEILKKWSMRMNQPNFLNASDEWLRLDERTNALDNLEQCEFFLRTIPGPIRWKWAIIALHQACYGFAVAAVQGTNPSVVDANDHPRLISFWEAINLVEGLNISKDEKQAIDRLVKELRNSIEHFKPGYWSIGVSGMPNILGHVLRVIEGIVRTGGVVFINKTEEQRFYGALSRLAATLGVQLPSA